MARFQIPETYKYIENIYVENKFEDLRNSLNEYSSKIMISPIEAKIISLLLTLKGAKNLLEIGTLIGYSSIVIASNCPNIEILSIEKNEANHNAALANISKYQFQNRIKLVLADAQEYLANIENSSFDAVFIDANKSAYPQYLQYAEKILKPGGVLIADNTLMYASEENNQKNKLSVAMESFNAQFAKKFNSIIIPTIEGLSFGIKL